MLRCARFHGPSTAAATPEQYAGCTLATTESWRNFRLRAGTRDKSPPAGYRRPAPGLPKALPLPRPASTPAPVPAIQILPLAPPRRRSPPSSVPSSNRATNSGTAIKATPVAASIAPDILVSILVVITNPTARYCFGHCLNIFCTAFCTICWFLLPLLFSVFCAMPRQTSACAFGVVEADHHGRLDILLRE